MGRSRRWGAVLAAFGAMGVVAVASSGDAAIEVHLTAAGDYGVQPATVSVLDEVARRSPDAHLALGDLSYGNVATEYDWCNFVTSRVGEGFAFQLVAGNHESEDNPDGEINNFSACLPNQIPGISGVYGRQYVMDFPTNAPLVRVIQASPNLTFEGTRWDYRQGDARHAWVQAAIADGRARGAQWIVVSAHYPCLTVGANGCPQYQDFYDLMLDERVDLVLHGHEHSYARTHQLHSGVEGCPRVPARSFDPDCVADADDDYVAGRGTVFATVGTGGIELRPVDPNDSEAGYFAAWSGSNIEPSHGLLDLRATEDRLSASFVSTSGAGFTDSFTVSAAPPSPTTTTDPATTTSTTTTTTTTTPATTTTDPATTTTTTTTTLPATTTTDPVTTTTTTLPATTTSTTTTTTTTTTLPATTTTTTTTTTVPAVDTRDRDTFTRTVASGWGVSDSGGVWSASPTASFSVDGDAGRFSVSAGTSRRAMLVSTAATDSDVELTVSTDKTPTGSGLYLSVIARSVPAAADYRTVVRTMSDGRVSIRLDRGTSNTIVGEVIVADLRPAPGDELRVRVQAAGTSPTTVRAKVWPVGGTEPSEWLVETTDATASMQAAGTVGVYAYLSSSATNAPITVSVDDLVVRTP